MFFPNHQTAQDNETLTHEHDRYCSSVEDAVIALQDSAFNLGRQRGLAEDAASRLAMLNALRGVVRVADRATAEFDAARKAIADAEAGDLFQTEGGGE